MKCIFQFNNKFIFTTYFSYIIHKSFFLLAEHTQLHGFFSKSFRHFLKIFFFLLNLYIFSIDSFLLFVQFLHVSYINIFKQRTDLSLFLDPFCIYFIQMLLHHSKSLNPNSLLICIFIFDSINLRIVFFYLFSCLLFDLLLLPFNLNLKILLLFDFTF